MIELLRVTSLLLVAAPPLLLRLMGSPRPARAGGHASRADRVPVLANFAALGLFFPLLVLFPTDREGAAALTSAAAGCLLAAAGAALVIRSRIELGSAWSLVARAHPAAGLVTTGPYRAVRHPVYLGFLMLTAGQALAFASWPALLVLLAAVGPAFGWRAVREEKALRRTFGERYELYRKQAKVIIPYVL